jgi:DNA-binding transcriptional regulator YdaS (Cro superfamily)
MNLADYFESQPRGTAIRLAKDIGAFTSDLSSWTVGKRPVPAERCPQIEKATNGQVRCEDLRPDVAWFVLRNAPELVTTVATHVQPAQQGG